MLKWGEFSQYSERPGDLGKFRSLGCIGKRGDLPMS